ncbi:hypothetical protein LEP1GSC064_1159 [Leptospira kirschneri serovar Grippotyphosa str. Moskva]|nr:hypothetical protein LEP1GSC064_1159 [Leptospira kirschneri serovar Grippotyphosa str. Moskva]EKR08163.1 hypothetical protein LEP1GSC122_2258 [Leptospira kirschneri serovar Valbuzzi str. 200702274]EMK18907.1 hypothetical protein LEP1GSC042_1765 [Leptospira kirschneri serovar Bim str. PUO 1247]EMN06387.1 hypothetical protein LEP1GSC046_1122 [Leptospira kirschneri serovar Bim str. 1051]
MLNLFQNLKDRISFKKQTIRIKCNFLKTSYVFGKVGR